MNRPHKWAVSVAVLLLALAASATSLHNGFAYDDVPIIRDNVRIHSLDGWWRLFGQSYWPPPYDAALYRPLVMLGFAVQWVAGGGAAGIFHVVNVVLYAAVCLAMYALAAAVLPRSAAFAAAALFAAHPVHVEAVGNVVGQAELWAALATLLAVIAYLRQRARGKPTAIGILALCATYALGCLAKEHAVMLPALLLAAECTLVADPRPLRARVRDLLPLGAALAAVAVAYLVARGLAIGGMIGTIANVALARLTYGERLLAMLGVVPEWARLLLWPARLSADYSPPMIAAMRVREPGVALVAGAVVLLLTVCLAVVIARRRSVVTFGLLWFGILILPVSNILVLSGVLLAERTLFLPSAGVCLAIGAGVAWLCERCDVAPHLVRWAAAAALLAVVGAGTWRSATRQPVWRDDETLFAQTVLDAPLNYRAHELYGRVLFRNGRPIAGERKLREALELYPYDPAVHNMLASAYREAGLCRPAIPLYREALVLAPDRAVYRAGLAACLLHEGSFVAARGEARIGLAYGGPSRAAFERLAAAADSALASQDEGRWTFLTPH
ncbi:MAG TPA: hypothetical protein VFY16_13570 [Gemmatimonadaceae bacterium]|nr:hypothetical protein [Gemmatimonadaceae bacterium]